MLGHLLLPVLLLVLVGLQSWATLWYAGRHGVDVSELAFRAEPRLKRNAGLVVFGGFAVVLAALACTVFTGHGLLAPPALDLESGLFASMVKGGVVGGGGGLLVGAVVMAVKDRRARRAGGGPAGDELVEDD